MTIYTPEFPSTKLMPYVYRGYNPTTSEFYIGSRVSNKVPSSSDLGIKYQTSSKVIKPRFHEFEWTIIAEFFDAGDAYDFEQFLIFESWKFTGMLNKSCYHMKARFCTNGSHSPATGRYAKGIPRPPATGKKAKGMPQTGLNAIGMPKRGNKAKGMPARGGKRQRNYQT